MNIPFAHATRCILLHVMCFCMMLLVVPLLYAQHGVRTLRPEPGTGTSGEARVALVIGNTQYQHARSLQNPANDARGMAQALQRLGFTVVIGMDLTHEQMDDAVNQFSRQLGGSEVGLFFYAGHGAQVDGVNYLIPVDAQIERENQVKYRTVSAEEVLATMEDASGRLNVVILDACRDNPFRSWRSSAGSGWSSMNGPGGSILVFATAPGSVASDNQVGQNGLYTQELLKRIETPELEATTLFRQVSGAVKQKSNGQQEPWLALSYEGDFYFASQGSGTTPPIRRDSSEDLYARGNLAYDAGNYDEAVRWYRQAAEQGHAEAQETLGNFYYNGWNTVPPDYAESVRWYRRAAEQGHVEAQTSLGIMYASGWGVAQNYTEAFRWIRPPADQGDLRAQTYLGNMYYNGYGVRQNHAEAARWYRRAAERGHAQAQRNLGYLYEYGEGVSLDYTEAARWYRRAAEQGHAEAQNTLGNFYYNGAGVSEDHAEAVYWYQEAALQGHSAAQNSLANMYYNGWGVFQDYAVAIRWYREAADQGHSAAQNSLANMYYSGVGVPQDYYEAVRWYRQSADQGYGWGQYNLGHMYENGLGVLRDYNEAIRWYRLAAGQGNEEAQEALRRLGAQ
ncbi:MAG: caspase family protein [Rhodothermales bacterium]